MKAYLITTGVIFGLMALMHVARAVAEFRTLSTDPGYYAGMAVMGLLAAALSFWAWRLVRKTA